MDQNSTTKILERIVLIFTKYTIQNWQINVSLVTVMANFKRRRINNNYGVVILLVTTVVVIVAVATV